ncbi:hypothetical protein ACJMK2_011256 [Sinanodonta woodiana]|uniref:Uncharacterized protein n=1 Tax=Sinanodonta woodiana TaxID=1069815 RepID=A0ABD3V4C9_SINWO
MATDAKDFEMTDILSAALDESGITGDDLQFDQPDVINYGHAGGGIPVVDNVMHSTSMQIPVTSVVVNGSGVTGGVIQSDVFSQALKQLAAAKTTTVQQPVTLASGITTIASSGTTGAPIFQRSASTPTIIKLPANTDSTGIVTQLPQLIRQQSAQVGGPYRQKIITVKRVGPNGNVTQSRSFAVGANQKISLEGQRIVVRPSSSVVTTQQGSVMPGITVLPTVTSHSMDMHSTNTLSSAQPVMQVRMVQPNANLQSLIGNFNVQVVQNPRTLLSAARPNPVVTTHTVGSTSGIPLSALLHSKTYSGNLSSLPSQNLTNVNSQARSASPTVQVVSHMGLSGGKVLSGSQFNYSSLTCESKPDLRTAEYSLNALQKSINNLPDGNKGLKMNSSSKEFSQMWSNQDMRLKNINQSMPMVEEEIDEEAEELGQAETYAEYMPKKLKIGQKHPDPVVESSSLASVEPPDIWYKLSLPESVIDSGELSALQLEAIVYASQRHGIILPSGERAGFLIGDGAGVGKGRTVAGIIYENYILGRKRALWLSVSNDLKVDAERDLRDIGAGKIDVHALNKFKYAKISSRENGSVKKGVIFATYSSLIGESHSGGKYKTRFKQILKWCGKDFDGVIVFDECHKAKNLCPVGSSKPTKTGQTVVELQKRLPKARIVYASATGASEPRNMAYMTRLGLWGPGTPFKEFNDYIQAVERRGVGAMELVAMDMKLRGMYIARQLSFHGVSFKIEEIPIDKDFVQVYNESVQLWVDAREMFQHSAELIDAEQRMKKSMWGQFWAAHQRFFKYLCISAKVSHCVNIAREAIKNGKCVVIGLQSTGEARTLEQLEESGGELNDFVSTAKGVFQTLVEKHFPAPDRRKTFDIFGLGGHTSYNEDSNSPTPRNNKRKKDQVTGNGAKKTKGENGMSSSDNFSDDSSESGFDFSLSEASESEESENDNCNPFGSGSESDDDPWLKKNKSSKLKNKLKKEKKKKKKKKDNMEQQFDRAIAAAGLLKPSLTEKKNGTHPDTSGDAVEKAFRMKRELLDRIENLGDRLPPNTLDQLIDDLGGPDNVAEMTGRKGRVVSKEDGISYESRSEYDVPLEILNLTEKQRFMDGEKNVAIISEAASSGISLQADRRALNQKRRVHLTLELPWSADRAIQQFGRTHRSNQVSAPEYIFLISELAGEQRFASTVAKRLESLGALTHGDRRATESRDLSRFNFDNKFGRTAVESVMKSVCMFEAPLVPPPSSYKGKFFEDLKVALIGVGLITQDENLAVPILEKDYNNISKFLNRMLGMEVEIQNALFQYFSSTLTAIILEAKKSGRWDMGILDLGSGRETVKKKETKVFVGNTATNTAKTELITVSVERGLSFAAAMDIWKKFTGVDDGFYLSSQDHISRKFAILAVYAGSKNKKKEKLFSVYRPNTGLQARQETLDEFQKKYKKVLPETAQKWWEEQYNASSTMCTHAYWRGNCKKANMGFMCEIGLRTRIYHILGGSVLSVWSKVESVLTSMPGGAHSKMQIIRLRTDDGQKIVGSLIPSNCVEPLTNVLSQDCSKTYVETHKEITRPPPEEESEAVSTLSMPVFF